MVGLALRWVKAWGFRCEWSFVRDLGFVDYLLILEGLCRVLIQELSV